MSNTSFVFNVAHSSSGIVSVNGTSLPLSYEVFMEVFSRCVDGVKNVKIVDTSFSYPDSDGFEQIEPSSIIKVLFYPCKKRNAEDFIMEIKNIVNNYFSIWLNSPCKASPEFFFQDLERLIRRYTKLK